MIDDAVPENNFIVHYLGTKTTSRLTVIKLHMTGYAGSLRNPETRRTPSYIYITHFLSMNSKSIKIKLSKTARSLVMHKLWMTIGKLNIKYFNCKRNSLSISNICSTDFHVLA